jgi:hypothetical protein
MRRVKLSVTTEMYAYVPVEFEDPRNMGLGLKIENEIADAMTYRAPYYADWEPGDAMLLVDEVSVSVVKLDDDPDPDMDTEALSNFVDGRSGEL